MTSHHPIRKVVTTEPTIIPDKLYFRIGDVARLCDVPAYVLRFWETEFPQLKPNKGGTGQRLYRKRDVEMALRIKSLLYDQGYTIPGARQVFATEPRSKDASEPTPQLTPATPPPQPIEAPPASDIGAAIRQEAQHRDRIATLREELRSLADLLSKPASPGHPAPAAAISAAAPPAVRPMRPRLVLEPRPASTSDPAPERKPRLVDQGDLFPSE